MATKTISAILRTNQAYYAQLSEPESLDWGIAYKSPRFPRLPEGNQFREIILETPQALPEAFDSVESYFAKHNLKCHRWAPAADQSVVALDEFLTARGFERYDLSAMVVRRWVDLPHGDVRVLPARAMRKAWGRILADRFSPTRTPLLETLVEAAGERLNDPQMDGFVATLNGEPAGCCTLYQVGDIGRVTDLYVTQSLRRRGVATALMRHVLRLARRLTMRITCTEIPAGQPFLLDMFGGWGLEIDGTISEFHLAVDQTSDG